MFDNVFASAPFWFWLRDKGKLRAEVGGRFIEANLEYGKNAVVQWIQRGGTVPLNDFKFLTVAQYQWRYLVAGIVRERRGEAGQARQQDQHHHDDHQAHQGAAQWRAGQGGCGDAVHDDRTRARRVSS